MGIAAHRDGFFRGLKDIQVGDRIELATLRKSLVYTVDNVMIVKPSDVSVLRARPQPSLTLGDLLSVLFRRRRTATLHRAGVFGRFYARYSFTT